MTRNIYRIANTNQYTIQEIGRDIFKYNIKKLSNIFHQAYGVYENKHKVITDFSLKSRFDNRTNCIRFMKDKSRINMDVSIHQLLESSVNSKYLHGYEDLDIRYLVNQYNNSNMTLSFLVEKFPCADDSF